MKRINLLLGIFIGLTTLACSSDDDSESVQDPENTLRFYKKSESFNDGNLTFDTTINYNSDKKIQSITTNDYGFNTEIITVNYSEGLITSITEIDNFDNPNSADQNITYDVIIEDSKITLTSTNNIIEINYSQGYVDSTTETNPAFPNFSTVQNFTRDSNLNLTSNTTGDGSTFTYADFDSNKKIDPFGSVTEYFLSDYFRIFDLKVTNSNPLTATYSQGSVTDTYNEYLEYDSLGYVIKASSEPNSTTNFTEHKYIKL